MSDDIVEALMKMQEISQAQEVIPFERESLGKARVFVATHAMDDLNHQVPNACVDRFYDMPDGSKIHYRVGSQRQYAEEKWWARDKSEQGTIVRPGFRVYAR